MNSNSDKLQDENEEDIEIIDFDEIVEFVDFQNMDDTQQQISDIQHQLTEKQTQQNANLTEIAILKQPQPIEKVTTQIEENLNNQREKPKDNYFILSDVTMYLNYEQFLDHPAPKGGLIQCRLYRAQPKFTLFLEQSSTLIMTAMKKSLKLRSSYAIFQKQQYLGKIKGDFFGTQYKIYNNGKTAIKSKKDALEIRKELGLVLYKRYIKNLRDVQVFIPHVNPNGEAHEFRAKLEQESISYNLKNTDELLNKKPTWIEKSKSYGLHFYGRVRESQVKNFILIEKGNDMPVLIFGKNDKSEFVLDFGFPLSPLQAFAIALSSIDHKFGLK